MKIIRYHLIILFLVFSIFPGFAQKIQFVDSASFYGKFCTQIALYQSNGEIQNNGSRVGLFLNQKLENGIGFFVKSEWSVNTVENNYTFNQGAVTSPDVTENLFINSKNAFDTRLGFFGINFKKYGTLTVGKQWSAYYDVSGWTDMFNVFGGQASGTYLLGTDGGETGLGRASKAVIFRNKSGPLKLALQTQLTGDILNYGGTVILMITNELEIGYAIYNSRISPETMNIISGSKKDNLSSIAGIRFKNQQLSLALTYNIQGFDLQHLMVNDTNLINGYYARGFEFFAKYLAGRNFTLLGGFNYQNPNKNSIYVSDDFEIKYLVIGSEYHFSPKTMIYLECKLDNSKNYQGNSEFNVYTLGFRFDFNLHNQRKM